MSNVKLAIVYYSTYGANHRMAEIAAEAARAAGAEVRFARRRNRPRRSCGLSRCMEGTGP